MWDLGANTGEYSRAARERGAERGRLRHRSRGGGAQLPPGEGGAARPGILPLLLDLTNPSPALGWAHRERLSLEERGPADALLALAVVHHLAIGHNLPLERVASFLARLGRHLIIEFVPKSDSQVQRLLRDRPDIFPDYTREGFEAAFRRLFPDRARGPGGRLGAHALPDDLAPVASGGMSRWVTQVYPLLLRARPHPQLRREQSGPIRPRGPRAHGRRSRWSGARLVYALAALALRRRGPAALPPFVALLAVVLVLRLRPGCSARLPALRRDRRTPSWCRLAWLALRGALVWWLRRRRGGCSRGWGGSSR